MIDLKKFHVICFPPHYGRQRQKKKKREVNKPVLVEDWVGFNKSNGRDRTCAWTGYDPAALIVAQVRHSQDIACTAAHRESNRTLVSPGPEREIFPLKNML